MTTTEQPRHASTEGDAPQQPWHTGHPVRMALLRHLAANHQARRQDLFLLAQTVSRDLTYDQMSTVLKGLKSDGRIACSGSGAATVWYCPAAREAAAARAAAQARHAAASHADSAAALSD